LTGRPVADGLLLMVQPAGELGARADPELRVRGLADAGRCREVTINPAAVESCNSNSHLHEAGAAHRGPRPWLPHPGFAVSRFHPSFGRAV